MDKAPRVQQMRRYIHSREKELLSKITEMSEDELRWTVRVFADCLDETSRTVCLEGYSEHLPFEKIQAFVASFIPQYTQLALADLDLKTQVEGSGLSALTEEELQNMSCAEKWYLLASDEEGLTPSQLRREMARLLFCRTHDLYGDLTLSTAAIEFPGYFEVQESLARLSPEDLRALRSSIIPKTQEMDKAPPEAADEILLGIREEIARAVSLDRALDSLFEGPMQRIPRGRDQVAEATPAPNTAGMSLEELQLSVKALTDLMTIDEMRRELSPLKERYASFYDIPEADLHDVVTRLGEKIGGRTVLSFTDRYRSGSLVTRQRISSEVWALLPLEERLRLLTEDDDGMDAAQMARHISRVFMSYRYEMLHDPAAQMSFLKEPFYQVLQETVVAQLGKGSTHAGLRELNRRVSCGMLEVEQAPPEERQARLLEVRKSIARALGLPEPLLDPDARA
jgi:hypothetical protein